MKIYTLFTILYFNLKTRDIVLVLRFSKAGGSTIRFFRVRVEVDNVFVAAVTFNSFRNYKAF